MKDKISIVDYGAGNLLSVARALRFFGCDVTFVQNKKQIAEADKLILPGVGAFGQAMNALNKLGVVDTLKDFAKTGRPMLGVCLGMQLLLSESFEFRKVAGLNIIEGQVVQIPTSSLDGQRLKVPHIGWSSIEKNEGFSTNHWNASPLKNISSVDNFYFVHSYVANPKHKKNVMATCNYGGVKLVAAVALENVFGTQFHPEKSAQAGLGIIESFLTL
jgi:glutamine amidotransferase